MIAALTWAAPWALGALVALPLLWWLYRRRPRFARLVVPSLQFFVEEPGDLVRRHRRALDADLWLALGAATALALAAGGPALGSTRSERHVRVVVAGGPLATWRDYVERRVPAALQALRAATRSDDRVEVLQVPAASADQRAPARRPSAAALLAAARAGAPEIAIVVGDGLVQARDVRSVALGDDQTGNVGIVAAAWDAASAPPRLLLTVLNDGPRPVRLEIALEGGEAGARRELERRPLRLGPGEAQGLLLPVPAAETELRARLLVEGPEVARANALEADDAVVLRRRPLRVGYAATLPAPQRAAVERALLASLGADGVESGGTAPRDLWVAPLGEDGSLPAGAPRAVTLALTVLAEGDAGVAAATTPDLLAQDPLLADVVFAGLELRLAARPPSEVTWLAQRAGPGPAGLLGRAADGSVVLGFDLLRGRPTPATQPGWPILVDNLVRGVLGDASDVAGQAGVRAAGLLDPDSTRLGRATQAFDPAWLAGPPPRAQAGRLSLAPPLLAAALVLLLLLWIREARRGRQGR